MSERLKAIWSGFEHRTTRYLTGSGVENIHVPDRREWRADDAKFLPEDFEAPAERAFAALKYRLSEAEAKHGRKPKARRGKGAGTDITFDSGERSAYGPSQASQRPVYGAGDPHQALLASLQETDFRTLRKEINYAASLDANGATKPKKTKRKKLFGLL